MVSPVSADPRGGATRSLLEAALAFRLATTAFAVLWAVLLTAACPVQVLAQGVVTRIAGSGGAVGSTDGTGSAARFRSPIGVVMNTAGTVAYVSDQGNFTIRRIDLVTSAVTTLAGSPGQRGSLDGTGAAAQFNYSSGLALTADGAVLFVAETSSHTIRQINIATAEVTTIAGTSGQSGMVNATGASARFSSPYGLALKSDGTTLYVADMMNCKIRAINLTTMAVTTVAGNAGGFADGVGTAARFNNPTGLAADGNGRLFVADSINNRIRQIDLVSLQVSTLAGNATQGSADGVGAAATNR